MHRMMVAATIAVVVFTVCPAYCNTYFVATTGNDTSGDGTIGNPYKTIGKAVGLVVAGDTIYVRGGTYTYTGSATAITLPSKIGSSSVVRCSLMGYNGERPLLDFSAMTGTGADGIKINGSYWYIKGIDFKGAPRNGIKISAGNYNIVEFCSSYENRNTGVQLETGASYNQIINCDSYYNYDAPDGGDADGFSPKMDVGTGNYFFGCRSWQNSDDGFDGYLRGTNDVSTTLENCWTFKNGYLEDGSPISTGNGNGFKMGGSDDKTLKHNFTLKNCLAFSNRVKGFDQNSNKGSMTLYNCTAFSNGGSNFSITTTLAAGKTAIVTNGANLTGTASLGSFVVQTTNSWNPPFSVNSADFVSIDPSAAYGPRNADGSLPDITFMHLVAGSDLVNGGTDVGLPYYGSAPDLGAFEYIGSDTTPPLPNPMTFATAPCWTSDNAILMVATTATDVSGVEYMFTCTDGGGHNSGWQPWTTYIDTNLTPLVAYAYTVTARDRSSNHNEATTSSAFYATEMPDLVPPSPSTMSFATAPYGASSTSVAMVATTATDASGVEYIFTCTSGNGHSSAWQDSTNYTDTGLMPSTTYWYQVKARDKSPNHNETVASSTLAGTTQTDTTPPWPSPMTFATAPYGAGVTSISMVASTATDISGVQYMFTCTSGSGHSSAWQDSTSYTDTGLMPSTTYTYTVKARDMSANRTETLPSDPASASTAADTEPPLPTQMSFADRPSALGIDSITMTAVTATDISGVEYFFACTAGGGHNSGWQDGTTYTDTGLVNNTEYTYRVIARDKSIGHNENAWSEPNSATTIRYLCTGPIISDLEVDCQVDFLDFAMMANHWSEVLPLDVNSLANGTFDTDVVPWQIMATPSATGYFVADYDNTVGNPVGSAIVGSDTDPDGTSGYWFYQMIPVIAGKQYKLFGEWTGDLSGYVAIDPCNRGNWAEVKIAFESSVDPNTWASLVEPNFVMYRKAFGSATQNIGPTGIWDWEQITASPTNGPADGVFTATGSYMVVAFGEGGLPASGVGYYYLDNLAVRTSPCPAADINGDCFLDMKDFAAFAAQWLACNRTPSSECGM